MRFINEYNKFKAKREEENVSESVFVRDNNYIVGGVEIKSSVISKYITKVKKETGKDLKQYFSESEIAESLVEYIIEEYGDGDTIPVSAILGGDESMEQEDVSTEEDDVDVSEEDMSEEGEEETEEEETDEEDEIEDPELESEDDDDFESVEDGDEDESEELPL